MRKSSFKIQRKEKDTVSQWMKQEAGRRKGGLSEIDKSEYLLCNVGKGDESICVQYEYARESVRFLENVAEIRKQIISNPPKQKGDVELSVLTKWISKQGFAYIHQYFAIVLAWQPGFPTKAWLALDDSGRTQVRDGWAWAVDLSNHRLKVEHPVFRADTVSEDVSLAEVNLESWVKNTLPSGYRDISDSLRSSVLVSGFFTVHLGYDPDEIISSFERWLLKRHPSAKKGKKKHHGGRRKAEIDRLNSLGASRMRFYCSKFPEAQKFLAGALGNSQARSYNDRSTFNRACRRAFKHFVIVHDLPEGDIPIHFTEGWQE